MTTPSTNHAAPPRASQRTRLQAWLLTGLFVAPLLIAFLLYYGGGWRPQGHTNHGDLIQPLRLLPDTALLTPSGQRTAARPFHGKWSLIYVGGGECDERCRTALTDLRQIRLALGRDMDRVQRVFLYTGNCCGTAPDAEYFTREQSGVIAASFDDSSASAVRGVFPAVDGKPADRAGRTYIADPLGNLVLSYAADAPRRGMLDDLKKLLKLSQIG